jgi:CRP-like cAMP-binding protein
MRHLQPVDLARGQVLYGSGDSLAYIVFPTTAVVSLMYVLESGATSETAVVGREGVVGVSLFMGGESALTNAVVKVPGQGWRVRGDVLLQEFHRCGVVQHHLLRYTQAMIAQMSQTSVCNRHHSVDQQLCRLLLLSLDRIDGNTVPLTHELMAQSLGVRREGVSVAAAALQRDGLIEGHRGRVMVLDRPALEKRSCECYAVVRAKYDELRKDLLDDDTCSLQPDIALPGQGNAAKAANAASVAQALDETLKQAAALAAEVAESRRARAHHAAKGARNTQAAAGDAAHAHPAERPGESTANDSPEAAAGGSSPHR